MDNNDAMMDTNKADNNDWDHGTRTLDTTSTRRREDNGSLKVHQHERLLQESLGAATTLCQNSSGELNKNCSADEYKGPSNKDSATHSKEKASSVSERRKRSKLIM
jgi:hypothetical protein